MTQFSTIKNLRQRYVFALSAIALLITASFITMQQVVSKQRDFSSLVTLAGNQTGLTNRIAYFVCLMATTEDESEFNMARAQIGRSIHKIKAAHATLRKGNTESGIPTVTNENLETIFEDPMVGLDLALERFLERAKTAYNSDMETFNTGSPAFLFVTSYGPHVLEPLFNGAAEEYEKIGREAIVRIERFELFIWLTAIVIILCEVVFIFRPMEKQVRKTLDFLTAAITKLENTQKRLVTAQNLARLGDWEFHTANGNLTWSDQVYEIFGVSPDDFTVTQQTALALVHPEDREMVGTILRAFIQSGEEYMNMEYRVIRPDGMERLVYQYAVSVKGKNNRIEMICGTIQDITERKELSTRLEKLSGLIPGFIFQLHLDGNGNSRIPYASRGIFDIAGLRPGQVMKSSQPFYELFHSEDFKQVKDNMLASSRELKTWRNRYRINHPQKGIVWLEGHATPERMNDGGTRWYGYIWDITARKREDEERSKLLSQLNQSNKMQAIGTLAGGIAHDFNNILSAILGYADLAQYHLENPEILKRDLNHIIKAAYRATSLVKQILAFSRRTEEQMHPLKLYLSLKETIKLLRSSIPANIEIKQSIHSKAEILADPTKVHQVIMNLCTNSYHAMGDNGGVLTVELEEIDISPKESIPDLNIHRGRYLRLTVADTGHGMDAATQNRIFEPYFTTKEVGSGTGLGLSVVDGIIKSQNGFIQVESRVGKGTSFKVFWPRCERQGPVNEEKKKTKSMQASGSERVMLVDDEADILYILEDALGRQGYEVSCFKDGDTALKAFKENPDKFDVVVTDMSMPKMTGDKLAVEILRIRKNTPIIICSGYHKNLDDAFIYKIGIRKFVQKPVDGHTMSKIIRETVDKKGIDAGEFAFN